MINNGIRKNYEDALLGDGNPPLAADDFLADATQRAEARRVY